MGRAVAIQPFLWAILAFSGCSDDEGEGGAGVDEMCSAVCSLANSFCSAYAANCDTTCVERAAALSSSCRFATSDLYGCSQSDPGRSVRTCTADSFSIGSPGCAAEETAVDDSCP